VDGCGGAGWTWRVADGGGAVEAVRRGQSMVLALNNDNDNARLGRPCGAAASRVLTMV